MARYGPNVPMVVLSLILATAGPALTLWVEVEYGQIGTSTIIYAAMQSVAGYACLRLGTGTTRTLREGYIRSLGVEPRPRVNMAKADVGLRQ